MGNQMLEVITKEILDSERENLRSFNQRNSKETYTKNRVGEKRLMNCGEECEIIGYNGALDIIVKFIRTGELVRCTYNQFKKAEVKSHFIPSVYGVGIVGLETIVDENGEVLKLYTTWKSMLQRCYSEKYHLKQPTYKGCTVCEEWLYYPNFKKWYEENYYEIKGQKMCLDKDILNKGNKVYSSENCVFVPQGVNILFIKNNASRGSLPIGVHWNKKNRKYQAQCNFFDVKNNEYKRKYLGLYNTPQEAFDAYKIAKEENVKQVADHYKNQIPKKLYEAMYRYEVCIDD